MTDPTPEEQEKVRRILNVPGTTDPPPRRRAPEEWERMGKQYAAGPGGTTITLYPIGAMATALGRQTVTIRDWEKRGWLPRPKFRGPLQGLGARRRLYTREQILAVSKIAEQEGLLVARPPSPDKTKFVQRVTKLFAALEEAGR